MRFVELSIVTPRFESTVDFYRRLLGAEPVRGSQQVVVFGLGGAELFVHRGGAGHSPAAEPFQDHIGFEVGDLAAACDGLRARGLSIEAGPEAYYWGRSAYLRDPDGRQVEVVEAGPAAGSG